MRNSSHSLRDAEALWGIFIRVFVWCFFVGIEMRKQPSGTLLHCLVLRINANYTLVNGLHVHPVYISHTGAEDRVVQERVWAMVTSQYDQT